ncbi:MAG TPA: cell wall hydrolase [Burkholderiales bacterium]|nr:cell wall hydrolase [Burkholderiales bacterium]
MLRNLLYQRGSFGRARLLSRCWIELRYRWHASRKGVWVAAFVAGVAVGAFGVLIHSMVAHATRVRDLTCLARNVYYEARGEPAAGRLAVAEVTMNRVRSRRFPNSVCEVVYQKNWDYLRRRYVSAFSWTEFDTTPHPERELWEQAWEAAEAVYDRRHPPVLRGATHYHATYIKPSWARGQRPLAKIGRHVFYR